RRHRTTRTTRSSPPGRRAFPPAIGRPSPLRWTLPRRRASRGRTRAGRGSPTGLPPRAPRPHTHREPGRHQRLARSRAPRSSAVLSDFLTRSYPAPVSSPPSTRPRGAAFLFYVSFILSELRRRKGRTLLTALGLGVGVALVVAVTALSKGLDRAQEKVLEPLTGVGTDMSATRPLRANGGFGGQGLSAKERDELQKENGGPRFELRNLGTPGQKFSTTNFVTTQLSFPASQVAKTLHLDGVKDASGGLTLNALTISGTVPKQSEQPQGPKSSFGSGGGGPQVQVGPRDVNADQV